MKRILCLFVCLCMAVSLSACMGKTNNLTVTEWEPSAIYSDAEIRSAVDTVKQYFQREFEGCSLTELSYPGDSYAPQFADWAKQYDADEAIVLLSSFEVGMSGGDGSLNPNSTYTNWMWVLVRDDNGSWQHVTHGY